MLAKQKFYFSPLPKVLRKTARTFPLSEVPETTDKTGQSDSVKRESKNPGSKDSPPAQEKD